MSMLSVIHNDVKIRDGPVTALRDVDCNVVRNVLRNTTRLIRKRRITRENIEPSILTAWVQHPGTLA